ncbi:MAG TPA: MXAN_2562 family outer membrane beta-barrel protein [Anaeromyxobacteraceae bacterium]|nr:MXAN_2562 family outer membrane beta-barrel protein [Anaeromyxobacteraceae bacterium]
MSRALCAALALLAAAVARPARAEFKPSPRWGSFEISLGGWRPRIDNEFGGLASPYRDTFGTSKALFFRADAAYTIYYGYGSLDIGGGLGYMEKYGKGFLQDGQRSGDTTGLQVVPIRAHLTYRFDWLADRYGIPLAPYARFSIDRYQWRVTNGAGNVSTTLPPTILSGNGSTMGWSLSGGIALQLDFFDKQLSKDMDNSTGINHTYLFVDFTKSKVNDFGSATSWDLSDSSGVQISGGLLFVF